MMMVVLIISCCPNSLRGDVTKWLFEINTGVYLGRVTARVGDMLWNRVSESIGTGHAIMILSSAQNEQHFIVRVQNSVKIPVDYDGITLMMEPFSEIDSECFEIETE